MVVGYLGIYECQELLWHTQILKYPIADVWGENPDDAASAVNGYNGEAAHAVLACLLFSKRKVTIYLILGFIFCDIILVSRAHKLLGPKFLTLCSIAHCHLGWSSFAVSVTCHTTLEGMVMNIATFWLWSVMRANSYTYVMEFILFCHHLGIWIRCLLV